MTEHIYMDEFFFHIYDSILKKLKKDNGYVERKAEEEQLAQQFSIIDNLREGKPLNTGATKQELEAVRRYVELKFEMQTYVEREHYFQGYRDCLLLLVHCGVIGTNFEIC